MERVMRIELTRPAWKAGVLPLNYTRLKKSNLIVCASAVKRQKDLFTFCNSPDKKFNLI